MLLFQIKKCNNIFYNISIYSFAIYLIHAPILKILVKYNLYIQNSRIGIYLLFVCVVVLSMASVFILSKSSILKRYLFMMKK